MKIKANKNFRDKNTKKIIQAGTVVDADQERIDTLKKHKIKVEIVEGNKSKTTKTTRESKVTKEDASKN